MNAPTKEGLAFLGWYDNANFTGSAINSFTTGVTGNKELYAKWEVLSQYSITYHSDGGGWNPFNKGGVLETFLADFYQFLSPAEDFNTFKHGAGQSSGYNGTWTSNANLDLLYEANNKAVDKNTGLFINQPEYNARWMKFFNLLDQFVREINSTQSFWGSLHVGQIRIVQYFTDHSLFNGKNTLPQIPGYAVYLPDSKKNTLLILQEEDKLY